MERRKKIALELSELVVYCRPVPFDEESKAGPRFGGGGVGAEGTWGLAVQVLFIDVQEKCSGVILPC
jgi:hypothetical protein